jgi:hypothetical protein
LAWVEAQPGDPRSSGPGAERSIAVGFGQEVHNSGPVGTACVVAARVVGATNSPTDGKGRPALIARKLSAGNRTVGCKQ